MRALGLVLLACACGGRATAGPATATNEAARALVPSEVLPAGICNGYFAHGEECDGVPKPTHVLLLADVPTPRAAEEWIARYAGKLAPGYPMVLTSDELLLDEAKVTAVGDTIARARTIGVVAGLF